jgi:hypothetical protein
MKDTIDNFGGPFDYVGHGIDRIQMSNGGLSTVAGNFGGSVNGLAPLWNFTQTSP